MRRRLLTAAGLLAAAGICFVAAAPYAVPPARTEESVPAAEAEAPTEPLTEPPTESPTEATEAPEYRPVPTEPAPAAAMVEDVPFYTQRGMLPTGCELVSAKMVLDYYSDEPVPIADVVEHTPCTYMEWIDGRMYAPHPEQAFIGDPYDESSYGCFAPVVVEMMNTLLPPDYTAVDVTGSDLQTLAETFLPAGTPVMIWATISMANEFPWRSWYLLDENGNPTEDVYNWMALEHCLVLVGYDESSYYFNDPYRYGAPVAYRRSVVDERYTTMGRYSIVVQQTGGAEIALPRERRDPDRGAEDPETAP